MIIHGDNRTILPTLPENSVDACVTDPPYHLTNVSRNSSPILNNPSTSHGRTRLGEKGFMGKTWDGGSVAFQSDTWAAVLRVLKPGAHLLAFGGTRTYHRMVCAIEDAGFEIRDQIAWVYGSGFPKSLDVSKALDRHAGQAGEMHAIAEPVRRIRPGADQEKDGSWEKLEDRTYQPHEYQPATDDARQWSGWGTALKPAIEPIVLARKPLIGTVAQNVISWGTGALNINACRILTNDTLAAGSGGLLSNIRDGKSYPNKIREGEASAERRYIESGGTNFAMKPGPRGGGSLGRFPANLIHDGSEEVLARFPSEAGAFAPVRGTEPSKPAENVYGEYGRHEGQFYGDTGSASRFFYTAKTNRSERKRSKHPTIKPLVLIRYLVRLITPPGGTVLDCFAGTGTTGQAALMEGMKYILIEQEVEYIADIENRLRGTQIGMTL